LPGALSRAQAVIAGHGQTARTPIATIQQVSEGTGAQCSFCRKHRRQVAAMASAGDTLMICGECVELCGEILIEEPPEPRR
jgi:bacterioferritin-associated ferredoxin